MNPALADASPSSPMYDFGVLRALRKREGLTLEEVAQRSGLSTAVISRLERNQSSAELETLFRLARVFRMTASDLLGLAEAPLAHRQTQDQYRSGGFLFQRIRYANVSCFLGTAARGAQVTRPEIHHDDLETCWVLEGRVCLRLPHETHELGAGESLQFDAIQAHTYEALEDSRLFILHLRKAKRY